MLEPDEPDYPLMNEDIALALEAEPASSPGSQRGVLFAVVSLALFVGGQALLRDGNWGWIVALVAVLIVHELGHLLAMRLLGFADLSMFFIPFFGAAASGRKADASATQRAIVALAGPVPGIVLAVILVFIIQSDEPLVWTTINLLLILNIFNLLPAKPLDGGRFLDIVLFSRQPELQHLTGVLGAGLLAYLAYDFQSWLLGGLAVFALLTGGWQVRSNKVGRRIRAALGPGFTASDTIPPEQHETVAKAVHAHWGIETFARPKAAAGLMKAGWQQAAYSPPPLGATLALMLVYLGVGGFAAWLLLAS